MAPAASRPDAPLNHPPHHGLILLLCCCALSAAAAGAPPSILFVLADDLGYGDISAYPNPGTRGRLHTPHVAQLAADGMMFTDAYAGYSVCAPSRRALMTGYHTGRECSGPSFTLPDLHFLWLFLRPSKCCLSTTFR